MLNVCAHQAIVQITLPLRLYELSRKGIKFHTGLTKVIPPKDEAAIKIELNPTQKCYPNKENLLLVTFYIHVSNVLLFKNLFIIFGSIRENNLGQIKGNHAQPDILYSF